jgi:hypothetical protein
VIFGFHTGTPAARYKVVKLHCLGNVIFNNLEPVPMTARSEVWVCGRSPAEIVGSNPSGGHGYLSVMSVVCYQVEVSESS